MPKRLPNDIHVFPTGLDILAVQFFQIASQLMEIVQRLYRCLRRRFITDVCHSVHRGLKTPAANQEIHRTIRVNHHVGHWQCTCRAKRFSCCFERRSVWFYRNSMNNSETPIGNEQRVLILCRELCSRAKCNSRRTCLLYTSPSPRD